MPCTDKFDAQSAAYQENVLGQNAVKVAIEAASTYGWDRYVGTDGVVLGIDRFGASAPINDLYTHFGLTTDALVSAVKNKL